jgi:hypothetical protein
MSTSSLLRGYFDRTDDLNDKKWKDAIVQDVKILEDRALRLSVLEAFGVTEWIGFHQAVKEYSKRKKLSLPAITTESAEALYLDDLSRRVRNLPEGCGVDKGDADNLLRLAVEREGE